MNLNLEENDNVHLPRNFRFMNIVGPFKWCEKCVQPLCSGITCINWWKKKKSIPYTFFSPVKNEFNTLLVCIFLKCKYFEHDKMYSQDLSMLLPPFFSLLSETEIQFKCKLGKNNKNRELYEQKQWMKDKKIQAMWEENTYICIAMAKVNICTKPSLLHLIWSRKLFGVQTRMQSRRVKVEWKTWQELKKKCRQKLNTKHFIHFTLYLIDV